MRLIIIGPEYAGKTTLARRILAWIAREMGDTSVMLHDHFLPDVGEGAPGRFTAEEEHAAFAGLPPFALEKYMRYMIHYHLGHHFYLDNDHLVVNWYYADAVYASLYFGYGGAGEYADRRSLARGHDADVMAAAPDTVLLHLTASAEAIQERMRAEPRPASPVQAADIETIRARFAEEFAASKIRRRMSLDTTGTTPEETLRAFLGQMESHLTPADRLRILSHRALAQA